QQQMQQQQQPQQQQQQPNYIAELGFDPMQLPKEAREAMIRQIEAQQQLQERLKNAETALREREQKAKAEMEARMASAIEGLMEMAQMMVDRNPSGAAVPLPKYDPATMAKNLMGEGTGVDGAMQLCEVVQCANVNN